MLTRFQELLTEDGVLVFTVYGRTVAHTVREQGNKLDLKEESIPQFLRDYDERGFAFFPDFAPENDHGDAMARRSWVGAKLDRVPRRCDCSSTPRMRGSARTSWRSRRATSAPASSPRTTRRSRRSRATSPRAPPKQAARPPKPAARVHAAPTGVIRSWV